MQCLQQFGKPTGEFVQVGLNDDGSYLFECMHGHKSETLLQHHKFEILFDIGAYAILDGYYREAVSSFASSLERFYEFCVRVISKRHGMSKDIFGKAWKLMSKQSERQLGAFIFLWVIEFGKLPDLLNDKKMKSDEDMIKFRNRVVHEGKIPNREEAIKFGNAVLEVLMPPFKVLRKSYEEEVVKITFENLQKASSKSGRPTSTMCESTVIGFIYNEPDHPSKSLGKALEYLKEKRSTMRAFQGVTS